MDLGRLSSGEPLVDSELSTFYSTAWFDGLRETVSGFAQTKGNDSVDGQWHLPGTIRSVVTILTSDADVQRKALVDFIIGSNGIQFLLQLLETAATFKVGEQTAKILRELISPKSGHKRRVLLIKQCHEVNYLAMAVSVLKQLVKGSGSSTSGSPAPSLPSVAGTSSLSLHCPDISNTGSGITATTSDCATTIAINPAYNDLGNRGVTTVDFIWFLAGVVAKDSRFASKVRQMLKVKLFHDVFKKLFFSKSNLHFPLLKIMKQLSKTKNRHVIEVLGKDKVMCTAKKAFAMLNVQPNTKLLMLMEWLTCLTRARKNCIRFLKAGLLVKVLAIFKNWEQWKGKGLLRLSKYVINIYTHLVRTKYGRKTLVQTDAVTIIRSFCLSCPTERSFDEVITRACAMIYTCYGKENLPLENLECPIKFEIPSFPTTGGQIPQFPLVLIDSGSSSDEDDPEAEGEENEDDSDNSDNESLNNDSDSENDDLCDNDDDQEGNDLVGSLTPQDSRRNSSVSTSDEGSNKTCDLDKIATFSYFFREFSPRYQFQNESADVLGISKLEKLEQSMSDCILQEREEFSLTLDVNENARRKSKTKAVLSANIPLAPSTIPTAVHKYSWTSRHGAKLPQTENLRTLYLAFANKIKHVSPFVKIAYPDFCFGLSGKQVESLIPNADRGVLRKRLQAFTARIDSGFRQKVVYNLDELIAKGKHNSIEEIGNNDEEEVCNCDTKAPLSFESRFECGNLRKAILVGDNEYDLFLTSDINSSRHNQWFYFQISNICDETVYTFNIVNCIKTNSLFNFGMQPVVFSVLDAMRHRPGWVRSGSNICYFRNGYKCIGKKSIKNYHTLSFTLNFHNKGDIVYIAYHIPYTYTRLMVEVHNLLATAQHSNVHYRYDELCKGLDGNTVPLITITGPKLAAEDPSKIQEREVVFITSRVHPGETNASWVMMGILRKLLLGNHVDDLLQRYVFKIVPMLNAEGVINGCHRSGLTSQDLNRCWRTPHEFLHASIFNTKMLVGFCSKVRGRQPAAFLDLHGHSRRKNAFFYGCSYARSWKQEDRITPENPQKLYALAESMSVHCPYFVMHFCHYDVRKSRETTARVAIWREYGITRSFTLECSYCGCDRGASKGITFGSGQLWEIGEGLCEAIDSMGQKERTGTAAAASELKQTQLIDMPIPLTIEG